MSALSPHIRVLRAEADAIREGAGILADPLARLWAESLAAAKHAAADQLEADEAALQLPRAGKDEPITYNPRGKH